MKYIVISRLAPGVENARQALEVYGKAGLPPGTEGSWAGMDGKTFISVVEQDVPDMVTSATYAPFFEETTTIPVVSLDDKWIKRDPGCSSQLALKKDALYGRTTSARKGSSCRRVFGLQAGPSCNAHLARTSTLRPGAHVPHYR